MQKVAVHITGEITAQTAQAVLLGVQCAAMRKIGLRVWICSIGGDILPALAIYDALKRYPASEAIATGECQSAALVAFLGAQRRLATPNTVFLHHDVRGETESPTGMSLTKVTEVNRRSGGETHITFSPRFQGADSEDQKAENYLAQLKLPAIDELDSLPSGYIDTERARLVKLIEDVYGEAESEVIEVSAHEIETRE